MVLISPYHCICKQVVPSSLIGKVLGSYFRGGSVRLAGGQPDRSWDPTVYLGVVSILLWFVHGLYDMCIHGDFLSIICSYAFECGVLSNGW